MWVCKCVGVVEIVCVVYVRCACMHMCVSLVSGILQNFTVAKFTKYELLKEWKSTTIYFHWIETGSEHYSEEKKYMYCTEIFHEDVNKSRYL